MRRHRGLELAMLAAGVLFVLPCVLALINSFKPLGEIAASPLSLPKTPTLENYRQVFENVKIARPMLNSALMSLAVILCLVPAGSMAAYSLARQTSLLAGIWRALFLAGLLVPFQVVMVPLLQEMRWLGIAFTYPALLLHYVSWGLPLCVFLYSRFLSTVPRELEDAGVLDGCGPWRLFWRVVFPLLKPCTVTVAIFWGLWIWNDFVQAFIVMGPTRGELAFVQLWKFLSDKYVKNWNVIFAGVVVLSLPVTALYVALQSKIERGLTAGALK